MKITAIIAASVFCSFLPATFAGDAVAMGYRPDGVWTSITYIRSSTPRGGAHYHNAADASLAAELDLQLRSRSTPARTKIIDQSDDTGYVTIMRGSVAGAKKGLTAVGRGKSQKEADQDALNKLNANAATAREKIIYRYFSYGSDAHEHAPTKRQAKEQQ